jgi:catecholate siderophore receptor
MGNTASNDGAGNSIRRVASLPLPLGVGERDEFTAALFYLDNHNGINYGCPDPPTASSAVNDTRCR